MLLRLSISCKPSAKNPAACERWKRAEETWETVTWTLARDPIIGEPLSEGGKARAFTIQGAKSIDMPTLTVLYEIQPGLIVIYSALSLKTRKHFRRGQPSGSA